MNTIRLSYATAGLAAGIGLVAGMRSMVAPAIISRHLSSRKLRKRTSGAIAWLGNPTAARWLTIMAAGEMIGDKMPFMQDRIEPPALLGRMASGAICGAAVAGYRADSQVSGAVIGAGAAAASTYAAYHLRAAAGRHLPIPDPVTGAAEDALALYTGSCVTSALE